MKVLKLACLLIIALVCSGMGVGGLVVGTVGTLVIRRLRRADSAISTITGYSEEDADLETEIFDHWSELIEFSTSDNSYTFDDDDDFTDPIRWYMPTNIFHDDD